MSLLGKVWDLATTPIRMEAKGAEFIATHPKEVAIASLGPAGLIAAKLGGLLGGSHTQPAPAGHYPPGTGAGGVRHMM